MRLSPYLALAMAGALTAVLPGCQGKSASPGLDSPLDPSLTPPTPANAPFRETGARVGNEQTFGIYRVVIDLNTLTTTVQQETGREGQNQADIIDLDAVPFLHDDDQLVDIEVGRVFRIHQLSYEDRSGDGIDDLIVQFQHTHPWDEPTGTSELEGRADLGYTGRLMIFADLHCDDLEGNTFFEGEVIANTEAVVDPDGYLKPIALETSDTLVSEGWWNPDFATLETNTFPYVLLADDGLNDFAGNREDENGAIGNSENGPIGNYDAANGGWHKDNLDQGSPTGRNSGWFGYDFVHQGQTVTNDFAIDSAWLESADESLLVLRVGLLLKYTIPVPPSPASRLPQSPPYDVTEFAYRLPHAALDISEIGASAVGTLTTTVDSDTDLEYAVRDWDFDATEHSSHDLSAESDVALVQRSASGDSTLDVDIPGVFSMTGEAVTGGTGAGIPGDLLGGVVSVENAEGALRGTYRGMVRVTDPEQVAILEPLMASDEDRHFGLDATDPVDGSGEPVIDHTLAMKITTYQAFTVDVQNECAATPAMTGNSVSLATTSGSAPTITVACDGTISFSLSLGSGTYDSIEWEFDTDVVTETPTALTASAIVATLPSASTVRKVTITRHLEDCEDLEEEFFYKVSSFMAAPSWSDPYKPTITGDTSISEGRFSAMMQVDTSWVSTAAAWNDRPIVCFADNDMAGADGPGIRTVILDSDGVGVASEPSQLKLVGPIDDTTVTASPAEDVSADYILPSALDILTTEYGIAILFRNGVHGDLWLAHILLNSGSTPSSMKVELIDHNDVDGNCSLAWDDTWDRAIVVWRSSNSALVWYGQKLDDWTGSPWADPRDTIAWPIMGDNDVGFYNDVVNVSNRLYVAYYDNSLDRLQIARAEEVLSATGGPNLLGEWTHDTLDGGEGLEGAAGLDLSMAVAPNSERPIVTYRRGTDASADLRVAVARVNQPDSPDDWTVYSIREGETDIAHGLGTDIAFVRNTASDSYRPAIVYRMGDQTAEDPEDYFYTVNVARACVTEPSGPHAWSFELGLNYPASDLTGWHPSISNTPLSGSVHRLVIASWEPDDNGLQLFGAEGAW